MVQKDHKQDFGSESGCARVTLFRKPDLSKRGSIHADGRGRSPWWDGAPGALPPRAPAVPALAVSRVSPGCARSSPHPGGWLWVLGAASRSRWSGGLRRGARAEVQHQGPVQGCTCPAQVSVSPVNAGGGRGDGGRVSNSPPLTCGAAGVVGQQNAEDA